MLINKNNSDTIIATHEVLKKEEVILEMEINMNNPDTDLPTILLNKFPEVIDKKDELACKNLNVFLTLNLYNEKYIGENNLSIHFKNSITGKNSIACKPFSKDKNSIQFVPYNDVHVNEAIAFSICNLLCYN